MEYLQLAKDWCISQSTCNGIIGQVIKQGPLNTIDQEYKCTLQSAPVCFIGDSFKIIATIQNNVGIIVVFSNKLLLDPGKCTFLCGSTHPPFLPFLQYEMNTNPNQQLIDFRIDYNSRVQIYSKTFEKSLTRGQQVPALINPNDLLIVVWEYLISQSSFTEMKNELDEAVMLATRQIKLTNALITNTIIQACTLFQKMIGVKPKLSQQDIIENIMNVVFTNLEQLLSDGNDFGCKMPNSLTDSGRFTQELLLIIRNLISLLFVQIEDVVKLLSDNPFEPQELAYLLGIEVENKLSIICANMHEFALVDSADFLILYEKLKETLFVVVKNIEQFIVNTSVFCNGQMLKMNQLFQDYPGLANIHTYQSIQTDMSKYIVEQLESYYLLELSDFWRIEWDEVDKFIRNIVICFMNYNVPQLVMPGKTCDFMSSLNRIGVYPKFPLITFQLVMKEEQDYISNKDSLIVLQSIQLYSQQQQKSAYQLFLQDGHSIIVYMTKDYLILTPSYMFNYNMWVKQQPIPLNCTLSQAVHTVLQSDVSFLRKIELLEVKSHQQVNHSKLSIDFSMNIEEQLRDMKDKFLKKVHEAQRVGGASGSSSMIAAGAVGSGLGILIVDCLDDNIPWQKKLQRAGFGTAESTAFATLSMQLPFVGWLVGQTFIFYNVHKVFSNNVLSTRNKIKTMGHIGVKTSMGLGSAIAGQMLIPIPFLGALIGSIVGGVGVGLYQKFVIPGTKSSLLNMVYRLEEYIQTNGMLQFNKDAINIMRISPGHFYDNKPEVLDENQWLTLVAVNLVNEVQYLFEIQCQEMRKKLIDNFDMSQLEKLSKLENEQDEMEGRLVKWEISRYYIDQQHISTFWHAKHVGEFVAGMIKHFRL